jgi:hypothetical protein
MGGSVRFVEDGPSIPDELLWARDQGRVVAMEPSPRLNVIETILINENFQVAREVWGNLDRLLAQRTVSTSVTDFTSFKRLATLPDWVVDAMRAEIEQSGRTKHPIDVKTLVRRLGLPRGMLEQAERIVRHEAPPERPST